MDVNSCVGIFSRHIGYVSLFPFLFGLIPPDSRKLGHVLDVLTNPNQLHSNYGIRSLSKQDKFFGKDENYWRGPIWININFLTLRALKFYYVNEPGPYQERHFTLSHFTDCGVCLFVRCQDLYRELRTNLTANIYKGMIVLD